MRSKQESLVEKVRKLKKDKSDFLKERKGLEMRLQDANAAL
jgi:hypothetical protein